MTLAQKRRVDEFVILETNRRWAYVAQRRPGEVVTATDPATKKRMKLTVKTWGATEVVCLSGKADGSELTLPFKDPQGNVLVRRNIPFWSAASREAAAYNLGCIRDAGWLRKQLSWQMMVSSNGLREAGVLIMAQVEDELFEGHHFQGCRSSLLKVNREHEIFY
jgi:hypothetical protein